MEIEDETGKYLVKLARYAAEHWITTGKKPTPLEPIPLQAQTITGAFVTVKTVDGEDLSLRGCIGFIIGRKPLYDAVIELANASTLQDPRFSPVNMSEFPHLVFEVTVMTPPETISYKTPEELLEQINIPGDGLIVSYRDFQGLLLPQVPIEQEWDKEEFISYTCRKAHLSTDIWRKEKIIVQKFQGVIFGENTPKGEIERKELS